MTKIENPVLPGFNPDPSFVRVGSDYYIATSTFEWFPGICIHHSTDLMNWEIISYALDDDSKFNIMGIDTSCGIWAPNLTYDHGTFYLVYTIVYTNRHRYKDTHNFLIMSNSVTGPWSDPISLNRAGFDPSIFHDPDGKKWLVNMLFDYRLDHKRFAGVGIQEYDPITKKLIGLEYNIFTGSGVGTTEGPNIFYYGGYYYLVTAEGGTAFDHCVTMCRAKNITGPYELCPDNPVLTSKGKEDALLKRAGHGQIIQAEGGNWFIAHLCSRTVDDCSILGRETAIQNMDYTADGWFRIHANEDASPESYFEVPEEVEKADSKDGFVNFAKNKVPYDYMTLRQSREKNGIRLVDGKLEMTGGNSLASKYNQCFLARRQQHFSYDFTAAIEFEPTTYRHMAGIACYYNYDNYHYFYISCDDEGYRYIEVLSSENKVLTESRRVMLAGSSSEVYLRAQVRVQELQFYYSLDGEHYDPVAPVLDMRILSDEKIEGNGFTGAMVGVCCQDLMGTDKKAMVRWINYED